jgi:hypothetical protein
VLQALKSFGASDADIEAIITQITQMLKLQGAAAREQLPEDVEVNDGAEPFTIGACSASKPAPCSATAWLWGLAGLAGGSKQQPNSHPHPPATAGILPDGSEDPSEPRKGLVGKQGLRAGRDLDSWTVIGPYRRGRCSSCCAGRLTEVP